MSKTARNDVTGDLIKSKPSSDMFGDNFDRIFRKKDKLPIDKEWDQMAPVGKELLNEYPDNGADPDKWDEKRVDTVGQNGNDGLHYEVELNKSTGEPEKKSCTNCKCDSQNVKGCD